MAKGGRVSAQKGKTAAKARSAAGSEADNGEEARALLEVLQGPSAQLVTDLKTFENEDAGEFLEQDKQAIKEMKVVEAWVARLKTEISKKNWAAVAALFAVGANLCIAGANAEGHKAVVSQLLPQVISEAIAKASLDKSAAAVHAINKAASLVADDAFDSDMPKSVQEATLQGCSKAFHGLLMANWVSENTKQIVVEGIISCLTSKSVKHVRLVEMMETFKSCKNAYLQFVIVSVIRTMIAGGAGPEWKQQKDAAVTAITSVLGDTVTKKLVEIMAAASSGDADESAAIMKFLMYYHDQTGGGLMIMPCKKIAGDDSSDSDKEVTPENCEQCFVSFTEDSIGFPMDAIDLFNHDHPGDVTRHVIFPLHALRGVNKEAGTDARNKLSIGISERFASGRQNRANTTGKGKVTFMLTAMSDGDMKKVIKANMGLWRGQMEKAAQQGGDKGEQRGAVKRDAHQAILDTERTDAGGAAKKGRSAAAAAAPASPTGKKRAYEHEEDGDDDSSMGDMVDELKKVIKQNDKKKKKAGEHHVNAAKRTLMEKMRGFETKGDEHVLKLEREAEESARVGKEMQMKMKELKKQGEQCAVEAKEYKKKFDAAQEDFDENFDELMKLCASAPAEFKQKHTDFMNEVRSTVDAKVSDLNRKVNKLNDKRELRQFLGAVIGQLQDEESDGEQ